ncbi:unnamed protein product [Lampetra planeri]
MRAGGRVGRGVGRGLALPRDTSRADGCLHSIAVAAVAAAATPEGRWAGDVAGLKAVREPPHVGGHFARLCKKRLARGRVRACLGVCDTERERKGKSSSSNSNLSGCD